MAIGSRVEVIKRERTATQVGPVGIRKSDSKATITLSCGHKVIETYTAKQYWRETRHCWECNPRVEVFIHPES